jgi:signal transduction histidine kinase
MTRSACILLLMMASSGMARLFGADVVAGVMMSSAEGSVHTNIHGVVTLVDERRSLVVVQDGAKAAALRMAGARLDLQPGDELNLEGQASPLVEAFPDYPDQPAGRSTCPDFEAPTIGRDNYLTRMRGWLRPPATGSYTFWIASDDSSELMLSSDASPAHAQIIASVDAGRWTEARQWDRSPGQRSRKIRLEAGQVYYIEAICQQGWGKDCLAVAWQGPGLARSVIEGRFLSPWVDAAGLLPGGAAATNGILREFWSDFYSGDLAVLRRVSDGVLNLRAARLRERKPAQLPAPLPVEIGQMLAPEENFRRVKVEGRLDFFSKADGRAELELTKGAARIRVCVLGDLPAPPENSLVRVTGVCEARHNAEGDLVPASIWVNAAKDVVWSEIEENWSTSRLLPMHLLKPANPELMAGKMIQLRGRVVGQESPGVWRLQGDDVFQGYASADGTNWNPITTPVEVAMNDSVLAGVAVASHVTNQLAEVRLDRVNGLAKTLRGADIGRPTLAGGFEFASGELLVRGAGYDIWAGADQCYFAHQPLAGDGEITVHVAGINAGPQAKAGVMIRESLDRESPWAAVMFTPAGRLGLQSRREPGKNAAGTLASQPVEWLKLTRQRQSLLVRVPDGADFPAGQMLDVRGRLAWTNNCPVLAEVHWRKAENLAATEPDETGSAIPSVGGDLRNVGIGELLAASERAQQAGTAVRFRIRGVVTFNGQVAGEPLFFVQDDSGSCLIRFRPNVPREAFPVGRLVELTGVVQGSTNFVTELVPHGIADFGEGNLPEPLPYLTDESHLGGRQAGQWLEVAGVVRAVGKNGALFVMTASGVLPVWPGDGLNVRLEKYVNASVRIRGVYWPSPSPMLLLPSEQFILTVEPAPANAFDVPTFSIASLHDFNLAPQSAHRVKIAGTITCLRQNAIFVQDQTGGIRVEVKVLTGLKVGDAVEVAGFLSRQAFGQAMQDTLVRRTGSGAPAAPEIFSLDEAMENGNNRLVTLEATLLERHAWRGMQILDLQSGQRAFRAVLPMLAGDLPAMAGGSRLRLTGVSQIERSPDDAAPGEKPITATVELLLRTADDVKILQRPPWWNWKYTAVTIGMLALVSAGSLVWIRTLRRRVEQRTRELRETMGRLQRETRISATLAERDRLAGEIHDSVEQGLSAIVMQMEAAAKVVDQPEEIRRYLATVKGMAGFSRAEVQHAVWDMQSPLLQNADLETALRRVAHDISAGDSPRVTVTTTGSVRPLAPVAEHHLLRIAQEAITNAVKHAGPKNINLSLHYTATELKMSVQDDGAGFCPETVSGNREHFGLQGMRSRARKINADCRISSAPGAGTLVELAVPFAGLVPPAET